MKRLIISESEKNHIKSLYNINEIDTEKVVSSLFTNAKKIAKDLESGSSSSSTSSTSSSDTSTSSAGGSSSESGQSGSVAAGEFFKHPNADSITLKSYPTAVPLNANAEKLLKSIFAEAGTPNLTYTSTLRTYEDQARANSQNRRVDILNWYGNEVAQAWDKLKANQMTQQQFADFLRERDKRIGKLMSNHLSGFAIDITPYSEQFASTAERLMKQGNSGIRKVLREKGNNAVHIEFNFSVTDKSGISSPGSSSKQGEKKSDKAISKQGIIIDKNVDSSDYAIVFGGSPSNTYGAQFMYQQGSNYLKNKNVVYSNFENSLDNVINYIKSTDPNVKISSVSGFSAGGKNAWDAAKQGYKAGLIDPVVTPDTISLLGNDLSGSLPQNIKMISRQENWSGQYRKHGDSLSKIENAQPNIRRNVNHAQMPAQFFSEFASFV
jgi:hypothetical protein